MSARARERTGELHGEAEQLLGEIESGRGSEYEGGEDDEDDESESEEDEGGEKDN